MGPIERALGVLDVTRGPDHRGEYVAFCCAHDDRNTPNLSVREAEDGSVLLRCFAGCDQERVLKGLEERGVSRSALFPAGGGEREVHPPVDTGTAERSHKDSRAGASKPGVTDRASAPESIAPREGCTLESYADHKGLPSAFLRGLGLREHYYDRAPAVRMPYLDETDTEVCVRFRVSLAGKPKIKTRRGDKHRFYGLWRLEGARRAGYALLVEGESDCHTAWYHDRPAVGIPGARSFRGEWAEELEGIGRLYVVVEPDEGARRSGRRSLPPRFASVSAGWS